MKCKNFGSRTFECGCFGVRRSFEHYPFGHKREKKTTFKQIYINNVELVYWFSFILTLILLKFILMQNDYCPFMKIKFKIYINRSTIKSQHFKIKSNQLKVHHLYKTI